jgi:hypothetical protein
MVTAIRPLQPSTALLLPADLPPQYCCIPSPQVEHGTNSGAIVARSAERWLPPEHTRASAPLLVDVSVTEYAGRLAALRALTSPTPVPDCFRARPLFPPRIGDETQAIRADAVDGDIHYVLYRVDALAGTSIATVAAVWRWPAGSPTWVYGRAEQMVSRLREACLAR